MPSHIDVTSAPAAHTFKRTPQGGLIADCRPTRCGVLKYTYPGGKVLRELRHPDEVFSPSSLATLAGAPVTIDHPAHVGNKVLPENYNRLTHGTIGDDVHADGKFVSTSVRVQSADAVRGVETGALVEMSCGYDCKLDFTSGEYEGEPYDAVMREITYNHVALLPRGRGRAGSEVGLKLDSAESEPTAVSYTDSTDMAEPNFLNAADFVSKVDHNAAVEKLQAKVDELTSSLSVATQAHADAKAATSVENLDKMVAARTALVESARVLAGKDFKCDGLSDADLRVAALKKSDAKLDLTGKSPEYITARFDAKLETVARADASNVQAGNVLAGRGGHTDQAASERSDVSSPAVDTVSAKQMEFATKMASQYKQTGVN